MQLLLAECSAGARKYEHLQQYYTMINREQGLGFWGELGISSRAELFFFLHFESV